MMLASVVRPVVGTWAPNKLKLALDLAPLQPVESHVHGFCASGLCCCQFAWGLGTICGPFLLVFGIVGQLCMH